MYSGKDTSPNCIEFSKNQTRIGRFVGSKNLTRGPCFQLFKIKDSGQFEKSEQVNLCEKEGKKVPAIRNTVIHDAENLGLVPMKSKMAWIQLRIRSSTPVIEYTKKQHTT